MKCNVYVQYFGFLEIRRITGSEKTITKVIKDKKLKWFGHVRQKTKDSWVHQAYKQDFPHPRSRGRPLKRWVDHIKKDTLHRSRWRQNRLKSTRGRHDLSN